MINDPPARMSAAEYRKSLGLPAAGDEAKPARRQEETALTIAFADYLRACEIEAVWTHVANERRDRAEAVRAWRMGLTPGVADFAFWLPNGRTLLLEWKTASGRQTAEQKVFEARVTRYGHAYRVARSIAEAYAAMIAHGIVIRESPLATAMREG